MKSSRGEKKNVSIVPSHFIQSDVSQVKGETSIFSNLVFYFVNVPSSNSLDSLHKMVVENGGTFSMNLNSSVTHCIASENKGIKFQAAKRQGDVIHYSWFFDCCSLKKLLPLQPKYFLFLSDESKKKLQEEIDDLSDLYYLDLDMADLKQIIGNIGKVEDSKTIEYYKKKLCPKEEWVRFHGCCIYFHLPNQILKNMNQKVPLELAMRRMKIEISIGGGSVAETLSDATHLVIVSYPQLGVDFDMLLTSFSEAEKRLLRSRRLQIVKSQWLEDSFEKDQKLPEDNYNLKPQGCQESSTDDSIERDLSGEEYRSLDNTGKDAPCSLDMGGRKGKATLERPRIVSLPDRGGKRKRGRPSGVSTIKGKSVVNQPRRTRPRVGNKPAKIYVNESDKDASSDDKEEFGVSSSIFGSSETGKSEGKSSFYKPPRTRYHTKKKPAEIAGNDSDKAASSSDEQTVKEDSEVKETNHGLSEFVSMFVPKVQLDEVEKDSKTSSGRAVELRFDEINEVASGSGSKTQYNDQLGDTDDPVQAMLLNMLPILATQKVESSKPDLEEAKSRTTDTIHEKEKFALATDMNPVKKKKVSYKDVANELLKDW
ncbi:hypothetical protein ACJIZ3_021653 [Penstemon smallii]|uniref:BRCT domain-containing protein n=1 Tax=Penstemon smallii TaxID=265156 RepID=A0ABD3SM14_9LAMI